MDGLITPTLSSQTGSLITTWCRSPPPGLSAGDQVVRPDICSPPVSTHKPVALMPSSPTEPYIMEMHNVCRSAYRRCIAPALRDVRHSDRFRRCEHHPSPPLWPQRRHAPRLASSIATRPFGLSTPLIRGVASSADVGRSVKRWA